MAGELETGGCSATSASANQSTCVNYIGDHGYLVGPKVKNACSYGAAAGIANPICQDLLQIARVKVGDALAACRRA
jgi:hypothetical protein